MQDEGQFLKPEKEERQAAELSIDSTQQKIKANEGDCDKKVAGRQNSLPLNRSERSSSCADELLLRSRKRFLMANDIALD